MFGSQVPTSQTGREGTRVPVKTVDAKSLEPKDDYILARETRKEEVWPHDCIGNTGQLGGMKKRSHKRKKNSFGTLEEERLHGEDVAKRMTSWRACQVGW